MSWFMEKKPVVTGRQKVRHVTVHTFFLALVNRDGRGRTFCRPVTTSFFSVNQLISTEMTLCAEEMTHFQI